MSADFDLKKILADPPKLHLYDGQLGTRLQIDKVTCHQLNAFLRPGMKTLETGGGLSTIIFAAKGCQHTCILPDAALAGRIQAYCRTENIEIDAVHFIIAKSCDAWPQVGQSEYDLVLVDGCHGFPSAFVDFCYGAKALKLGGTLVMDDMHIFTCRLVARFMESDDGWDLNLISHRVAFATKVADTIDNEWINQPFVVRQSNPRGFAASVRSTISNLKRNGLRVTTNKIFDRIFGLYFLCSAFAV